MGRQQWLYRLEPSRFPEDFPQRLVRFKEAAGFSWRGLAARMGLLHLLLPEAGEPSAKPSTNRLGTAVSCESGAVHP